MATSKKNAKKSTLTWIRKFTATNSFDVYETWALFLLFTTTSQLVYDINQQITAISKKNLTDQQKIDAVSQYFINRLAGSPFNLDQSLYNINDFVALWSNAGKLSQSFDSDSSDVAAALGITYAPPPCPPDTAGNYVQTALWHRFTNSNG